MKARLPTLIATAIVICMAAVSAPRPAQAEARAQSALPPAQAEARAQVRERLVMHGVGPAEAEARVQALTDAEAETLARDMETLPAGGFIVVVLYAAVLVIVLITAAISKLSSSGVQHDPVER